MMNRPLLAALLATLASASAMAQPAAPLGAPPAPAPDTGAPPSPGADAKAEAKAHYEKGLTHYNLGEWDLAIGEFRAAYAISSAPGLLFNIAQSFRLKKDFEQASYFYKTFLRLKPEAANRADVEARIDEMDKALAEQKAAATSAPRGTVTPEGDGSKPAETKPDQKPGGDAAPTTPTVTVNRVEGHSDHVADHRGQTFKTAGIATAGAGGALLLTGLVFGAMAGSAQSDLNALNAGGTWTQSAQDKYDAGKRDNTIAVISFIAGGAAVATGATLFGLGYLKDRDATVAVVPTTHGASFAAVWSF